MTQESDLPSPEPTAPAATDTVPEAIRDLAGETQPEPSFGWNSYAERMNGRFAMVGFVALLLLEWWTNQTFFTWLGLR